MTKYNKEQLWGLFKMLPDELKDTIFSEDTAINIPNICQRHEVEDKKVSKIAELVGNSLMGLLPPDEFQDSLEKEINIEPEKAKKISQEINRFIFYPVKKNLASLYEVEFTPGGKIIKPKIGEKKVIEKKRTEEGIRRKVKKDIYREPVE